MKRPTTEPKTPGDARVRDLYRYEVELGVRTCKEGHPDYADPEKAAGSIIATLSRRAVRQSVSPTEGAAIDALPGARALLRAAIEAGLMIRNGQAPKGQRQLPFDVALNAWFRALGLGGAPAKSLRRREQK